MDIKNDFGIKLYIKLLRYALRGETLNAEDIEKLSDYSIVSMICHQSKNHDVLHITGKALMDLGVVNVYDKFYQSILKAQTLAILRYEKINYEYQRLCDFFEKEKIDYLPLKGSIIRPFYPYPEMRTSCDIDILIKPLNLEKATVLLQEKLNYRKDKVFAHDVSFFSESGVHLELHFQLQDDANSWEVKTGLFFNNVWEYCTLESGCSYRYKMNNEMFAAYNLVHTAKHFVMGGCGVRAFMDLWIIKHRIGFEESKLYAILSKCRMARFGRRALYLAECWFGDGKMDEFYESMQDYVIRGGLYSGKSNVILTLNSQKNSKFKYVLKRIFMPYKRLCISYPSLKSCPILYPIYLIIRWFRIIFGAGRSTARKELKFLKNINDKDRLAIRDLCDELGL